MKKKRLMTLLDAIAKQESWNDYVSAKGMAVRMSSVQTRVKQQFFCLRVTSWRINIKTLCTNSKHFEFILHREALV